jgi:hypothetical protein
MSADPIQNDIFEAGGAREQVILPNRVAFGICARGIRARLGRSVVTLLGVGFGIAFLMSILCGFHIKGMMRSESERQLQLDRYINALQAETGILEGKKLALLVGAGSPADRTLAQVLADRVGAEVSVIKGDGVDVPGFEATGDPAEAAEARILVGVGDWTPLVEGPLLDASAGKPLIYFQRPDKDAWEPVAARLTEQDVQARHVGIELREDEKTAMQRREREQTNRAVMIVVISLLITVIGITNAMLMSVTERFREIGTMKCLGALSSFVVKLFLIESSFMGFFGSLVGIVIGAAFPILGYSYQFGLVNLFSTVVFDPASLGSILLYGVICIGAGVVLAVVAGIYPARVAAKMVPAVALSSNV